MEQNQRDSIPCQRLQPLLEYHMQPFYMLKGIPDLEFALMEKNMSLNLSLVKMPHSNFKDKAYALNTGVGKCSCGKTFEYASERDMKMKLRMHLRFCSNPPVAFDKIRVPKKEAVAFTIPERNQEATLYLQELASTLLIQKLVQVHLQGNTSCYYQGF